MKIPNTACSSCNQALDLIFTHKGEFGQVNEGRCYNCNKEYPLKACKMCKEATVHIGFNYGACISCILNDGFNMEKEYCKAVIIIDKFLMWINCEPAPSEDLLDVYKEGELYLATIERQGYDKKYYINDINEQLPDSNQGVIIK